jgi:hypothetical protein
MTVESAVVRAHDTLPMSVANMTFLVNRLGEDCAPLQFVRELTQNGLEAVALLGDKAGQVVWDVDWSYFDLSDGISKLACIDTGAGMTGPEMVRYINELSSSIHQQSAAGNFGVGAKIAAAPRNPHGLVYMSWKGGIGHMIHLWFDPQEKVYGLKRWAKNNGEFWTPVSDDLKPKEIDTHGTMVVLLGASDEEKTIEAPAGAAMRSRWILRYLNTRYFRFPPNIQVKAREGWDLPRLDTRHNFLRLVEGQQVWLDKNCAARGEVPVGGARVHWWILRDDVDRDSGHFAPGGHIAALFQNELYEMLVGRAGIARLQAFGVIFGADRVVIYVEPHSSSESPVTANTARTQLLVGGESLDWTGWASDFRESMPDELTSLQEQIGAKAGEKDHKKAILERLRQIKDLLRFSRFKPAKDGAATVDPDLMTHGGDPAPRGGTQEGHRESGKKGGRAGDIYALFAESGAVNADPVDSFDEPKTQWVSVGDGTRVPPDLDDRAAKFLLQQNLLMINGDFRVFTDMVDRWTVAYAHIPGAETTVKEVVHEWFEQQLIEAVMSAQALKNTGKWSIQELESLWVEAALTAAVLPRWHIDQSIKRSLGIRLGSLKQAA